MEKRLQATANDTVLEIIETAPVKRRLSEKALLRRKETLKASIANFQEALSMVDVELALISTAKHEARTKG